MGWDSAIKKPWSGKPGGAFQLLKDQKAMKALEIPDPVEWTQEDLELCGRYAFALAQMAIEDRRFELNNRIFLKWDIHQKLKWIAAIEQQALDGKDTIGVLVVTRVVMNRLD